MRQRATTDVRASAGRVALALLLSLAGCCDEELVGRAHARLLSLPRWQPATTRCASCFGALEQRDVPPGDAIGLDVLEAWSPDRRRGVLVAGGVWVSVERGQAAGGGDPVDLEVDRASAPGELGGADMASPGSAHVGQSAAESSPEPGAGALLRALVSAWGVQVLGTAPIDHQPWRVVVGDDGRAVALHAGLHRGDDVSQAPPLLELRGPDGAVLDVQPGAPERFVQPHDGFRLAQRAVVWWVSQRGSVAVGMPGCPDVFGWRPGLDDAFVPLSCAELVGLAAEVRAGDGDLAERSAALALGWSVDDVSVAELLAEAVDLGVPQLVADCVALRAPSDAQRTAFLDSDRVLGLHIAELVTLFGQPDPQWPGGRVPADQLPGRVHYPLSGGFMGWGGLAWLTLDARHRVVERRSEWH